MPMLAYPLITFPSLPRPLPGFPSGLVLLVSPLVHSCWYVVHRECRYAPFLGAEWIGASPLFFPSPPTVVRLIPPPQYFPFPYKNIRGHFSPIAS